jgi:hypothetical protein
MNSIQNLVVFIFLFGFISTSSSSEEGNLLLNICFQFGSCRSDNAYLKLTPVNFNSNMYDYTIDIPTNYPFYTSTGPMHIDFYVIMNVSNTDFNNGKNVAKSVLYDTDRKEVLALSDIAYSSNEMLLISPQLSFDAQNEAVTKLIVYQFNDDTVRQSDPYILTFKRNQ